MLDLSLEVDKLQKQILVVHLLGASFVDPIEFVTHQKEWEETNVGLVIHKKTHK
jgi:hypothetical protein